MGNFNQMHEGGGGRGWADNAWSKQFLNCFSQGREIASAMVSAIGSLVDMKMVRSIVDGVVERIRDRDGGRSDIMIANHLLWLHITFTWLQILYIVASTLTLMHILLHGYIRVSLTWLHISLLYMVAYHLTCCISHYMVAYILPWLHISLYGCISHYRVAHHITWLHNSLYGCISPCMVACNLTWLHVILHGCM